MRRGYVLAAVAVAVLVVLDQMAGKNNNALDVAEIGAGLAVNYAMGADVVNMQLSDAGLAAIARREGFSAKKYPDAGGFSIGYGHFIQMGESFDGVISQADAMGLLLADTEIAQRAVRAYVTVPLTQNQFDALTSLVYNIGAGNFKKSQTLADLNAGDNAGAAAEMAGFNKSGGEYLAALAARRADEVQQFFA